MEETGLFHKFISAIPDDVTFPGAVQTQRDWNDSHAIKGGSEGQVLTVTEGNDSRLTFSNITDVATGRLVGSSYTSSQFTGNAPSSSINSTTITIPPVSTNLVVAIGFWTIVLYDSINTLGVGSGVIHFSSNHNLPNVNPPNTVASANYVVSNLGLTNTLVTAISVLPGLLTYDFQLLGTPVNPVTSITVSTAMLLFETHTP